MIFVVCSAGQHYFSCASTQGGGIGVPQSRLCIRQRQGHTRGGHGTHPTGVKILMRHPISYLQPSSSRPVTAHAVMYSRDSIAWPRAAHNIIFYIYQSINLFSLVQLP